MVIRDEAQLRELIGEPTELVVSKITDRLNHLTRRFIELSPFVCLATSAPDGRCDVSPRGDPAGFVRILDDRTLLLPDRPGNRIADSLRNILQNPRVGLLFLLPGVGVTFRVNGRAALVTDEELLAPCVVEGRTPKLGILIEVEEAYTQCPKALLRSDLWNPDKHVDKDELPTTGEIFAVIRGAGFDAEEYDAAGAARYARREGFY
jgi:PPOX class probable FMN-dependent enzyme